MVAVALVAVALGLPAKGVVVPGASLAGVQLGATQAQVRAAWGRRYGRCRDCAQPTWYYTYRDFQPQGAGVTFRNGRATALFTIWSPPGWHTNRGLTVGQSEAQVTALYGVPTAYRVRHVRRPRDPRLANRHPDLRLQERGLGLRAQPGWISTVPLAAAASSRLISEATSGMALRMPRPHSHQSTW